MLAALGRYNQRMSRTLICALNLHDVVNRARHYTWMIRCLNRLGFVTSHTAGLNSLFCADGKLCGQKAISM